MARDQSHSAENKVWAPFAKALQNASLRYSLRVLLTALAMTAVNGKHPKKLERLRAFLRFTEKRKWIQGWLGTVLAVASGAIWVDGTLGGKELRESLKPRGLDKRFFRAVLIVICHWPLPAWCIYIVLGELRCKRKSGAVRQSGEV